MSRYLIRRIEEHPAIVLCPHSEIVALDGEAHLERVRWRNTSTGEIESRDIRHVFVMAGAKQMPAPSEVQMSIVSSRPRV